jgi:amidase
MMNLTAAPAQAPSFDKLRMRLGGKTEARRYRPSPVGLTLSLSKGVAVALGLSLAANSPAAAKTPKPAATHFHYETIPGVLPGVAEAQGAMTVHAITAEGLVKRYLTRIAAFDRAGPSLHAIIALNPHALADARKLDAERKAGHVRGPLHGVPVLLKDNIESDDDTATTAGSLALAGNVTHRDAPLVKRLTDAGAVILGKTNLSEWANIRSSHSISGWSAVGGLVRNPYALDRSACGSSAGSGAAGAASLAAAVVGSETDGSITCPSSMNGLVGLKPTLGLISRTHIVPISHSQDTAGPMARSVEDVAAMLTAMAGSDPADPATKEADAHKTDYLAALSPAALTGKRIGVIHDEVSRDPQVAPVYAAALERLKAAGATLVEIKAPKANVGADEFLVLLTELKADMNAYLASTDPMTVIAFDKATPRETLLFGDETFEAAEKTKGLDDPAYLKARADSMTAARAAIDEALAAEKLDAIVLPTTGPAWRVDTVSGDHDSGSSTTLPAVSGYPHLTVPMGQVRGMPLGLSFWGPRWSEARLLGFGFAYQQKGGRFTPPTYRHSVEGGIAAEAAFSPSR